MNPKLIPSICTLSNLLLGVLALINIIDNRFNVAAIMILLAMILDGMDGRLARRFDATSAFGKELDSLADLVSFGVSPGILVYAYSTKNLGWIGLFITIIFVLCGAIRLARFNILNITTYFLGVPITAAGSFMALLVLVSIMLPHGFPGIVFPVFMLALSALMISNIKIPKH